MSDCLYDQHAVCFNSRIPPESVSSKSGRGAKFCNQHIKKHCSVFYPLRLKYAPAYHWSRAMRLISMFLLASLAGAVCAADAPPPDLQPLPPPPALDPNSADPDLESQVTITRKKDVVIEEYRVAGKLYKIKVIPKVGKPYYLIDERGDGEFSRMDGPDAANMRPPRWVLFNF
jgi:hypothetical protein